MNKKPFGVTLIDIFILVAAVIAVVQLLIVFGTALADIF